MSSSKGQESSFLRSGFRFASVPNRIVSLPRTAVLGTAFLTVCGFMYSLSSLYVPSPRYHEQVVASNTQLKHDHAKLENVPISNSLQRLFDAIRLPISAPSYTDDKGNTFEIEEEGSWWDEPLKKQILIVDIDTRVPDKTNELWSEGSMDWEKLEETGGGMLSASQMNHFLYGEWCFHVGWCASKMKVNERQRKYTDTITVSTTLMRWRDGTQLGSNPMFSSTFYLCTNLLFF